MKAYRDQLEFSPIKLVIETQEEYATLRRALDHFANNMVFTDTARCLARDMDFALQEAWRQ